ncbi:ribonuclease T2 [Thelephora ganbajun]|uniref:Ribonuclease T2 n=1 Tax=Thelephora ganbajun TaxID=370292 RepID=A0ACB6Z2F6_THEGA|nr:ribonuclease T2 [Thelephora ganbajun]
MMGTSFGFLLLAASVVSAGYGPQSSFLSSTVPNLSACSSAQSFYSCENTTVIENTCCSPTPGGLVLFTQFWSTWTGLEDAGQYLPKGSWTIHGAWPDNCNGSFEQYCDFSRQYDPRPSPQALPNGTTVPIYTGPSIDTFVAEFGRYDLLEYMNKYWINQGAPNADLWAHEFSKHGTCTSTFDVACYTDYQEHEEVVNYFETVVRGFQRHPTYDLLAAYGITPSNETTYPLAKIQDALKAQIGALPYLGCSQNGTSLSEAWYFGHVFGTEQYGHFKPLDATLKSNCKSDVHYYQRSTDSEREVRL